MRPPGSTTVVTCYVFKETLTYICCMLLCYRIFFLETSNNSILPTEADSSCTSARGARRKIESFDCPGGVFVY